MFAPGTVYLELDGVVVSKVDVSDSHEALDAEKLIVAEFVAERLRVYRKQRNDS